MPAWHLLGIDRGLPALSRQNRIYGHERISFYPFRFIEVIVSGSIIRITGLPDLFVNRKDQREKMIGLKNSIEHLLCIVTHFWPRTRRFISFGCGVHPKRIESRAGR